MLGHFSHANVVVGHDLSELLIGIGIPVIAAVTDAHRRMPVALRYALGPGRATGAETFTAGAAVMLGIGWQKILFALVAVADLVVGAPVGRRNLVGHPGCQRLCRLQGHARYGLRQVGDAIDDALRRVLRR